MSNNIKEFLHLNREGIFMGGIIGAITAYIFKWKGIDLTLNFQTQGLIDSLLPTDPVTFVWYKTLILFILVGVFLGMWVDILTKEGYWKKWL